MPTTMDIQITSLLFETEHNSPAGIAHGVREGREGATSHYSSHPIWIGGLFFKITVLKKFQFQIPFQIDTMA